MPKVYIAADHAGFALKEALIPFITSLSFEIEDCGVHEYREDDDYPDAVMPCAKKVAEDTGSMGIVIGASGQGEAMVANRVSGVRAAVYYGDPQRKQTDAAGKELSLLESTREHNDANVLSLGAKFMTEKEAQEAVRTFLMTPTSSEERHVRRRGKF